MPDAISETSSVTPQGGKRQKATKKNARKGKGRSRSNRKEVEAFPANVEDDADVSGSGALILLLVLRRIETHVEPTWSNNPSE